MNKLILILSIILLCTSCTQTRLAVAGIDAPEVINNYEPITPVLVGKATGVMVAANKKSNQIWDDTAQAIIKELCVMEREYKEYWIKRQWKKNGIDYRRACDSLNGEITEGLR